MKNSWSIEPGFTSPDEAPRLREVGLLPALELPPAEDLEVAPLREADCEEPLLLAEPLREADCEEPDLEEELLFFVAVLGITYFVFSEF